MYVHVYVCTYVYCLNGFVCVLIHLILHVLFMFVNCVYVSSCMFIALYVLLYKDVH